jgi:hypothetical protein
MQKMMRIKTHIILAVIFGLSACQADIKVSEAPKAEITADITLRATSDIQTPLPIKAASFVPNNVATWLGHIILLDEKGVLHRATTESAKTDVVAIGKYVDVVGFGRENKSGVFLALTPQGQVKAFVQIDDEGNFGPMAVSVSNLNIERFCPSSTPNSDFIWLETKDKQSHKMSVEVFEDTSVTLKKAEQGENADRSCKADNALRLSATYAMELDTSKAGLTVHSGDTKKTLDISDGLSIGKVKDVGFATVTTANMGSVYNEGVLLIAERDEGRLVLISRAYALKEISSP